jgi:hypothetical protein
MNEPGGIRTHDLRIKSPLLYRLSYELQAYKQPGDSDHSFYPASGARETPRALCVEKNAMPVLAELSGASAARLLGLCAVALRHIHIRPICADARLAQTGRMVL